MFLHVLGASRTKWDTKSKKCIFLGHSEESKDYQIYNLSTKKITISHDVVFMEQPHEEEEEGPSLVNQETPTYHPQPPVANQPIPTKKKFNKMNKKKQMILRHPIGRSHCQSGCLSFWMEGIHRSLMTHRLNLVIARG